jgi:hypothetical protein
LDKLAPASRAFGTGYSIVLTLKEGKMKMADFKGKMDRSQF